MYKKIRTIYRTIVINILYYNRFSLENMRKEALISSPFVKKYHPISIYYNKKNELSIYKIYFYNRFKI